MNNKINSLIIALVLVLLTACQAATQVETGSVPTDTQEAATASTPQVSVEPVGEPESGKATIVGQVISTKTNAPMVNMGVRLAEVHRQGEEGAFLLDTAFSPGDFTDEGGYFRFEDVEPGEYVMVVGNVEVYQGYVIIPDTSGRPLVYNFEADKITDMGSLTVNLDPLP